MLTILVDNHGYNMLTGERLRDTVFIRVDDESYPCATCPHGMGVHMGACRVFCCGCGEYAPMLHITNLPEGTMYINSQNYRG